VETEHLVYFQSWKEAFGIAKNTVKKILADPTELSGFDLCPVSSIFRRNSATGIPQRSADFSLNKGLGSRVTKRRIKQCIRQLYTAKKDRAHTYNKYRK
jgi:hypothetical protein